MDDKTVPELTGYQATAAELRRIADALDTMPPRDVSPYLSLSILPSVKTVEEVDALGMAILGKPGETSKNGDGWRHKVDSHAYSRNSYVGIHATVPGPPDERDAELEKLRARVAELQEDLDRAHVGALDEDNQRAKAAVIESLRPGELDRVTNPNLARFLAHREDARRAGLEAGR